MARLVLWKVLNTTARDALVVAEPEVGNYALVYADGLLYRAIKGGTGSGVWESEEALSLASIIATGAIAAGTTLTAGTGVTSTTGAITATAGAVVAGTTVTAGTGITATTGAITATAGAVVAGTTVTTPKLNAYPVNTAALALTDAANIVTAATANNVFTVTIGATRILDNPTGLVRGGWYSWEVTQGGLGSFALTYGNLFKFRGGAPTLTAAAGSVDVLFGYYNGTVLIMDVWLDVKA